MVMVAKVSPVEVFKETIALIRHRIKFIAGMFFIMLLASTPFDWQMAQLVNVDRFEFTPVFWAAFLFSMVVGTVVQVCVFNNFIQTLRSKSTPLIPQKFVGKCFVSLFKELLWLLIIVIPGVVVMVGFSVVLILIFPVGTTGIGVDIITSFSSLFGFGLLGVRLGAVIAAAAMGEKMSFKHSWKMTRGHTFALALFLLPVILFQAFGQLWIRPALDGSFNFFSPSVIAVMLLTSISYWSIFTAFSVWYERLCQRYAAMNEIEKIAE
jgi:hypothetical protein